MFPHFRHALAAVFFLCIASVSRPSNADAAEVIQWIAPDGTVITVRIVHPQPVVIAPAPPPIESRPPNNNRQLEQEVLALTNARRAAGATCGGQYFPPAAPLAENAALHDAAVSHSAEMGARDYFDHTSLDGRSPANRARASGFRGGWVGENIYAGPSTAAAVVDGWMKSPGHCKNIMNAHYRFLGVGYANVPGSQFRTYWTQDFGG